MAKFCNGCGAALAANAQFCGSCGASVAQVAPPPAAGPAPSPYVPPVQYPAAGVAPPGGTNLPWIIAGAVVLLLGVAVAYLFMTRDKAEAAPEATAAGAPAEAVATEAVGAEVLKYVTSQTNIRNIATAQGPDSRVVGTLSRGQQVRGTMHRGLSGDSYWFKLADGRGYVSAINLSDGPPGPETAATASVRPPLPNGTYCSVITNSGNLRIRNAPAGAVIGAMPRGSRFQAFDQQYDRAGYIWVHIQPIDGRYPIGWVLSSYISC
ncbi:hypothetical protein GV829_07755 [Sphingomonas lacunae]|uniref:SH3 domain-containing protein n=1 Tax=Sphingomonas lacunae TaxID=2698828 RepID=A0A6M4ATB8_9SPHN|nr:hypothetical protein [Sphingomonas lacunae]QJQ32358.1 hypothetical protein GV829_07755 [Sphingomonas lacunae]